MSTFSKLESNTTLVTANDPYGNPVSFKPVLLPKTDLAPKSTSEMEASLVPLDLHVKVREACRDKPLWLLHDGPPYANGDVHVGHALNKVMKDALVRGHRMNGYNSTFTPGWDCHGLPIEWQVEKNLMAQNPGFNVKTAGVEFRQQCREWANKWVEKQAKGFVRMGVLANWDTPYLTMSNEADSATVTCLHNLLNAGLVYRALRPVQWSVTEKTALADAEVVYREVRRQEVTVLFPVVSTDKALLKNTNLVCWTSTPWSLPGNRAVAVAPDVQYSVFEVLEVSDESLLTPGQKLVFSSQVAEFVLTRSGCTSYQELSTLMGHEMASTLCEHPLKVLGFNHEVPVLMADFVASDVGTGLVHVAPDLGPEDYTLGLRHGLPVVETVTADGRYSSMVPHFANMVVMGEDGKWGTAQASVVEALEMAKTLVAKWHVKHEGAHSWRSGVPLLYRATAQWFLSMKNGTLDKAKQALDDVTFLPADSRKRMLSMLEGRPDWCVSRQRLWGVPLGLFVNRHTGEVLMDDGVFSRVQKAFQQEGSDAWWSHKPEYFLGDQYSVSDWEATSDVLDVWFESGATWSWVVEGRYGDVVADLYLEGSDQHRGWFQSSLLESTALRGRAPFKTVLTHGFVLDGKGKKMSKSEGNVVDPLEVCDRLGADVLRLWALSANTGEDVKWSDAVAKAHVETLRKFRNTLKWLLGNLPKTSSPLSPFLKDDFVANLEEPERWMLSRLYQVGVMLREDLKNLDTSSMVKRLFGFCVEDLSGFWFDMRKDCLYCDGEFSAKRQNVLYVLEQVRLHLTTWLAPLVPFLAEEAWVGDSVHLESWQPLREEWLNEELSTKWESVKHVRKRVLADSEPDLKSRALRAMVEAHVEVWASQQVLTDCQGVNLAMVCGVSGLDTHVGDFKVVATPHTGNTCLRCRGKFTMKGYLCQRCEEV